MNTNILEQKFSEVMGEHNVLVESLEALNLAEEFARITEVYESDVLNKVREETAQTITLTLPQLQVLAELAETAVTITADVTIQGRASDSDLAKGILYTTALTILTQAFADAVQEANQILSEEDNDD